MNPNFVSGALFMGCFVAGLFFLKFHARSREALFLWFGLGFALMAIERAIIGNLPLDADDFGGSVYLLRMSAFLCIAGGIVAKNRRASTQRDEPPPPRPLRSPPDPVPGADARPTPPSHPSVSSASHS